MGSFWGTHDPLLDLLYLFFYSSVPSKVYNYNIHKQGVTRRESSGPGTLLRIRDSELMNCFWCPVHLKIKMRKSSTVLAISILVLLSLASQVSRCAASAEGIAGVSTKRHRLRPHLQVQEQLHGDMKDHLEFQSPSRKLGPGHQVVSTVELKHHGRITTGHKGGSAGGGAAGGAAGAGAGGRNVGGGGAVTRPHGSKNGAAALPVPVALLALGCGVALSALSY
ncbi:hypothetical protein BDA96_07G104100 [Sorghum bicolor]|uniref:Uncharacterized protein n=2 Tax=Sorghum bicolor TaxID=4558 RepID=A0A921UA34_SORBI|nr:uncharacterized protein LOC8067971 isoform X2 [Sorghum bicolor]KAG0523210.1 hypothetical protein BDA96_07G104100 [Sorghum bicolor]KXG24889.1 hypothetical protein SORBI_3007G097800 [Sorghum bicolor]|eukprot:XP_021320195.1 uncharacterized protein LOC8067971 isoform X2 [Sorghum bicolor]